MPVCIHMCLRPLECIMYITCTSYMHGSFEGMPEAGALHTKQVYPPPHPPKRGELMKLHAGISSIREISRDHLSIKTTWLGPKSSFAIASVRRTPPYKDHFNWVQVKPVVQFCYLCMQHGHVLHTRPVAAAVSSSAHPSHSDSAGLGVACVPAERPAEPAWHLLLPVSAS